MKVSSNQPISIATHAEQPEKNGRVATGRTFFCIASAITHCGNVKSLLATENMPGVSHALGLAQFHQRGCQDLLQHLDRLSIETQSPAAKMTLTELMQDLGALKETLTVRSHCCLTIAGNLEKIRNIVEGK